ncbi:MAG: chemotaxis protein CheA [Lachnospiraceae bacterium]|nr:chemotaxis protein CheA [Lachnospiraceae bacterium]
MDVSQYLEIFIDETKEHLQSLNEQLLIIEKEPENTDTINEIFRAAHSLKGMAGTMGYKRMQKLTHQMENVFSEIRNGKMKVDANLVDVLFQCLDALEEYLDCIQESADEGTNDNEPILKQLEAILNGGTAAAPSEAKEEAKQPESDDDIKKYKEFKFAEFEKHAMQEAFDKKQKVYAISVQIEEACLLKAARAFLVFKSMESIGEIIKSQPSVQDIEDEKFEQVFSICIITDNDLDKVIGLIKNVSEIKEAVGEEITALEGLSSEDKKEKTEQPQEVSTSKAENVPEAQAKKDDKKPVPAKAKTGSKPVVNRSVRVDIEKLDILMNLVSELIIAKNGLISTSSDGEGSRSQAFNEQIEYLERVTTNLHESVMKVRMMPIETVTNKFPRMIRDLSKKLDKKMELYMTGEDTELDRTVIDEIGDPLMHLLRNSADHGLETADVRAERGKPEVGTVRLDAYQDGNNVVIEVSDDGNGINVEGVRNSAINKGSITAEQAESMTDKEIIDLLFKPSFSTAKKVTDISGRGVGLDVVKTKIESLGGDIEVKTQLGEGSTFIIRLPLTLAIIQALMVELGDEKYAISLGNIQTIEDIPVSDIRYVQTKEVIHLRGAVIPLIRLDKVLDIESTDEPDSLTVVIVKKGDKQAGLVVDRLLGQQEIVIKSLGKYISNSSKIISGATILGNGEVALIIDVNTLL